MSDTEKAVIEEKLPQTNSEDLVLLDPGVVECRTEKDRLQIRLGADEDWRDVTLARLFPLSEPEHWISVVDKEDKEIGVFETLRGMAHESLASVRAELHRRYMVPEITRIVACRTRFDLVEWTVETNRGRMTFLTKNPHEQFKPSILPRIMLTDVEGNRFDIPDVNALDEASRAFVEQRM